MKRATFTLAMLALAMLTILPAFPPAGVQGLAGDGESGMSVSGLSFSQPGDATWRDADDNLLMSSGVLYYLNFTLAASSGNVTVTLDDKGYSGQNNYTNYYSFSYLSTRTPAFQDDTYSKYLQASKCSVSGASMSFAFGVHAYINQGLWSMNISSNGAVVHSEEVSLEMGRVGIGISTPTFNFKILPFEAKPDAKCNPSAITVWNMGNIVSKIIITFDQYSSYLEATNRTGIFDIESSRSCEVIFDAPSLPPQKKAFKGHVEMEATNFITVDMVNFIPKVAVDFDLVVEVCREGCEILDIGAATIQYERRQSCNISDDIGTEILVGGSGSVTLEISCFNLAEPSFTIEPTTGYTVNGLNITFDLDSLAEGEEFHVVFVTTAYLDGLPEPSANATTSENFTIAYLNYTLDDGAVRSTASSIFLINTTAGIENEEVGESEDDETLAWLILTISITIIVIVGIVVIMAGCVVVGLFAFGRVGG